MPFTAPEPHQPDYLARFINVEFSDDRTKAEFIIDETVNSADFNITIRYLQDKPEARITTYFGIAKDLIEKLGYLNNKVILLKKESRSLGKEAQLEESTRITFSGKATVEDFTAAMGEYHADMKKVATSLINLVHHAIDERKLDGTPIVVFTDQRSDLPDDNAYEEFLGSLGLGGIED